ncbi:MAG: AI-2E family transporter, partial [Bacteroidota bacterium]
WGPAAIIMLTQGEVFRGVTILVVGALFIGLIDNFLRPRLVGQDTKMPDYLILISTLGGLTWFGLSGFVLGPIIAALFITCWQMLGKNYGGGAVLSEPISENSTTETAVAEEQTAPIREAGDANTDIKPPQETTD